MENQFDPLLQIAKNIINTAETAALKNPKFEEIVLADCKISTPKFDKKNTRVDIEEKRTFNPHEVGGLMVDSMNGSTIECAHFSMPIIGDSSLFKRIASHHLHSISIGPRSSNVSGRILNYREYSQNPITGDNIQMEEIRNNVIELVGRIEADLAAHENKQESFKEATLKPYIKQQISLELNKKEAKSDAESKMNPFK